MKTEEVVWLVLDDDGKIIRDDDEAPYIFPNKADARMFRTIGYNRRRVLRALLSIEYDGTQ